MRKRLIGAFVLFFTTLAFTVSVKAGQPAADIVSWFLMDINHDLQEELLVISGSGVSAEMKLDTGEKYGNDLKIYSDFEVVNHVPLLRGEPDSIFDLSKVKPLKVQSGDINGDGEMEIAVCVYKTTKFHPVLAKRPFFYSIQAGQLQPVWLGSRLARPFVDYILYDADADEVDEIISIELLDNGNQILAVYDWKGFGFEVKTVSEEFEGEMAFLNNKNGKEKGVFVSMGGENHQFLLDGSEIELPKCEENGDYYE